MKTFREFILEAEERKSSDWWTRGRKEASQTLALLRRQRGGTVEQQISTKNKIKELEKEISNNDTEHSDTRPQETKKQKRQQNAVKNTGRAQKPRGVVSSVGTEEGRSRVITNLKTGERLGTSDPNDVMTAGIHGEIPTGSGGKNTSRSGGRLGNNPR